MTMKRLRNPVVQWEHEVSDAAVQWRYDFFQARIETASKLLKSSNSRIDSLVLIFVTLFVLARYRYPEARNDIDAFQQLLRECASSFVERVSIPELLRDPRLSAEFISFVRRSWPIEALGIVREANDDPTLKAFNDILGEVHHGAIRDKEIARSYVYSRLIGDYYRNSLIHILQVANGREADAFFAEALEIDGPFYANQSDSEESRAMAPEDHDWEERLTFPERFMRFGVTAQYMLRVLDEVIHELRGWGVAHHINIFGLKKVAP